MTTWDLYFATLVGMAEHPGYLREGTHKPTLEECAIKADEMMKYKLKEKTWPSAQQ